MRKQPNSRDCFICGIENGAGLRMAFYETTSDDGPEVLARFTGDDHHQSYPGRMHGGVITGILDEVLARAIMIGAASPEETVWGVAADLSVRFRKPVPLGVELTARGRITRNLRLLFEGSGEIYLPDGSPAATATGKYMKMPLEKISDVDADAMAWRVYGDDESVST